MKMLLKLTRSSTSLLWKMYISRYRKVRTPEENTNNRNLFSLGLCFLFNRNLFFFYKTQAFCPEGTSKWIGLLGCKVNRNSNQQFLQSQM